jgi:hypothetical protein
MSPLLARAAVLLALIVPTTLALAQSYSEGGYADRHSVVAGGTIAFHISTSVTPFNVEIVNMASQSTVRQTLTGLTSQARDCTGLWENGCAWPVTTTFTVPAVWAPGYYGARFPTVSGTRYILFVVRSPTPGSYAPIAVIQPSNTDVAYNRWGGKSVYDNSSTNGQRAHIVSFDRPYHDNSGLARFQIWEEPFVRWMKSEGRPFEVITDDEMEAEVPLGAYKALVIVGHSEYWSLKARNHLEQYVADGGNLAIFGGNTMWWQVRVDLATRQMTVYKDADLDPMTGVNDDVVTFNFFDAPIFNRENTILGASFANAGYVNRHPVETWRGLPPEERIPYTVTKADHWVYEGTGVTNGGEMGRSVAAIEVDGALFNTLPSGEVVVEGSDGTPLNTEILATVPASYGYGTIGIFTTPAGGAVFNGAARDWSLGLESDPVIQRITRNVLERLSNGVPFEYIEPRATPNRVEDLFNTPVTAPDVLPGWYYDKLGFTLTAGCAFEGPTGLRLAGTSWTQVVREFGRRAGVPALQANLMVNTNSLTASATFATPLVEFIRYRGAEVDYIGALEIHDRPAGRSLRVTAYRGALPDVSTPWVVLPAGWQSVTMAWASPGTISLNVAGTKVSVQNTDASETVNAVMLEYASRYMNGTVCLDRLQVRDVFAPASGATSTITATPASILANGTATATITVRLVDEDGFALVNGGDVVTIASTRGTVSNVADAGNGTYTATLSGTSAGAATISATVNGNALTETATVTFEGTPSSLALTAPATAIAGEPFAITVTARDAEGQPATGYRGTVHFTSNSAGATLPSDYTFTESDNGSHQFTGLTLQNVGTWSVTVTDTTNASMTATANIDVDAATTTSLVSSRNPSSTGQSVTFTAEVESPATGTITGTVTFFAGTTQLGTGTLTNGVATYSTNALSEGTHAITAEYAGDANFIGSTSSVVSQVVNPPHFGAPSSFHARGTSTTTVNLSWSVIPAAVRYDVYRRGAGESFTLVGSTTSSSMVDSGRTPGTSYLYFVRAVSSSNATADSARDVGTTVMFRDDPLTARRTLIRERHITQLRTAVNAVRALAGLPAAAFTDPTLGGVRMKVEHVTELRAALSEARAALGLAPISFTDPTLTTSTPVKAAHIMELRNGAR